MGQRFNEELMTLRRWPKLTVREAMRKWRENHGLMDSKAEVSTEGSSPARGDDDTPTQDGEEPARGNNRLAVGEKRNTKRRKTKGKRAS